MNKPDSLRDLLLQAVPGLRKNPERPLMFIDQGKVRCAAAASLSFEYSYTLQMILTDFDGHTDSVMIPILDWLRVNQSELLVNTDKSAEGLKFEADMLDRSKVDLSLTLPLTERVIVTRRGGGGFAVEHAAEPQYEGHAEQGSVTLFADDEPIATWHRRR